MSNSNQIARERLYLNAEKTKIVPEGAKAAFLYASKGDEIPASACERFGIKDGMAPASATKPAAKKPAAKAKSAPANKEKAPAENKGTTSEGGAA